MGATEEVARFIVNFDFREIPPSGVEQIKVSILDTLGTALVGAARPIGAIMTELVTEMGGNPQARLIGSGLKTSVLNAALANGTMAHADDYDTAPHCGVVMLPTALALGEKLRLSGEKILEAYAVAYEVGHKMRYVGGLNAAGFHSTCVYYTMAAAAESAKLLGLNMDETRATLGIAASLASGITQNFGTFAKPLHAGHAARSGVLAATLAKKGFTGDPDVLEGYRGFFHVYGQGDAEFERVTENIGKPLAIAKKKLHVKAWPNCASNQPALTAIFRLIEEHDIKPEQVDTIEVVTSWKPPGSLHRSVPKRGLEGKFSMPYSMATALVDRKVDVNSYTDEKLARPMIQNLMKKVTFAQDPTCVDRPPELQSGVAESKHVNVTVRLKDGRILSQREEDGKQLKGEEVNAKYRANAEFGGFSAAKIDRTMAVVDKLEDLKDITELVDTVTR